ncbi:hypothetical protein [Paraliomyxa miuraensis]|uniref:hypothetical protein n=1 Tax=Paraliomyxa miuraensis TaxID=376150 RepID=UPI002251389A|nr:hypothetical protein [Paraliomyxa miuraensis]MCX4242927.1 hypothetical protein [Paraliomyxa miuraensis]
MRRATMTMGLVGLVLGCGAAPGQILPGGGSSTGEPVTSTSGTTVVADGTTAVGDVSGTSGPSTVGSSTTSGGSSSGTQDGSSDGSSSGEPMDEPLGPFEPPVPVVELNVAGSNDDDPTLTGDMLEIYFASTRNGSQDIFVSTRASVADPWDAPVPVDPLNSPSTETTPEVSIDGLVISLASNRPGAMGTDIYAAGRLSRADPWPTPLLLMQANTPMDDFGATISPNMDQVFLCWLDQPGGMGQSDIWRADVSFMPNMVGTFSLVAELSSTSADCTVSMAQNEREIIFESTRLVDGADTVAEWNLWVSTRQDAADPWGPPVALAELNTPDFLDNDPWLSLDRRTLYMASTRGGSGDDIYVTTRR